MDGYLRQSTASQSRLLVPTFLDDTDFKTPETALTINNTDIKLRANGTTLSNKNSGGGTHQANGQYSVTWDATDSANVGQLAYSIVVAGALPVFGSYTVLEEAVYDAIFASGATMGVNLTSIGSSTAALDRFLRGLLGGTLVTVAAGSTTTSINTSAIDPTPVATDQYKGRAFYFPMTTTTTGLRGSGKLVTASTVAGVFTLNEALPTAPAAGDIAIIL